jgi:hypothetical protein
MTREREIFLDIKKDKALITTMRACRNTLLLIHYSCSAGCSVSESKENAHSMAHKSAERSVDSAE